MNHAMTLAAGLVPAATPKVAEDRDVEREASDLLILLVKWGRCADCDDCKADIDGDCTVGASDHLILLSNWG